MPKQIAFVTGNEKKREEVCPRRSNFPQNEEVVVSGVHGEC